MSEAPVVIGWSVPEDTDNGFVEPSSYANPDIICHKGATNAQTSATVAAGGQVSLEWTAWPSSHHGPVIDYLAKCSGNCETADKTALEFFKIDEGGLIDDSTVPGTWASDQLIANNNTWTVTIPSDIAPGNYVLRHEIIALHSAGTVNGAQNYPQCINLEITGSGTATPSGVLGTALYTETDPGIEINIYQSLSTYVFPGPTLYSGAASETQTQIASPTGAAGVSSATTTAVVTSAAAVATSAAVSTTVVTSAAAAVTSAAVSSSASSSTPVAVASSSSVSGSPSGVSGFPAPFSNCTATSSSAVVPVSTPATTPDTTPVAVAVPTSVVVTTAVYTTVIESSTVVYTVTASSTVTASGEVPKFTRVPQVPTKFPVGPKLAASHTAGHVAPSSTPTAASVSDKMPAGTTFADLMSWLNTIVHEIADGNKSLLGRRHARDLAVRR